MQRIANFSNYHSLLDVSLQLQANVAQQQSRTASGLKSDSYSGVAGNANLILDLESELSTANAEAATADRLSSQVEAQYATLTQMTDLLANFRAQLTEAMSGTGQDTTALSMSAQGLMEEFAALMNSQYAGGYMFGGTVTDQPPVDLGLYPAQTMPSSSDTSYYQGNNDRQNFMTADGRSFSYSLDGSDSPFEESLRALSLVANMTAYDSATLTEAYNLTQTATDDLATQLAETSQTASGLEGFADEQTDLQLFAEGLLGDLTGVDVAEASAELTLMQTHLEASYNALAKSLNQSILDYL